MSKEKQADRGTQATSPQPQPEVNRSVELQATFKRLAVQRVNKALKAISLIGNLASYKPSIEQVAAVEKALADAHNMAIQRLKGAKVAEGGFNL